MAREDRDEWPWSRLTVVLAELRALAEPIALLRRIAAELTIANEKLSDIALSTRFNRGGYDGPFLVGHTYTLGPAEALIPGMIFGGSKAPTALLIEIEGTGVVSDELFISDDSGAANGGFRVGLLTNTTLRIIADARQQYYAKPSFTGGTLSVTLRVREGRL